MLRSTREALDEREEGFTLIELLVVVIIIGILAAIAIPVFLNQREKAWNSAAKSDLRNAAVIQESYFTDASTYASSLATLEGEGFNKSADVTMTISGDNDSYCMSAVHDSGGDKWYLGSDTGAPATTAC